MNEQQHKNQIDSLAAAIQESLYYLRKISDKSSSETQKAKATIEHCIQFEHCDVEIKINLKEIIVVVNSSWRFSQSVRAHNSGHDKAVA